MTKLFVMANIFVLCVMNVAHAVALQRNTLNKDFRIYLSQLRERSRSISETCSSLYVRIVLPSSEKDFAILFAIRS